MRSVVVALMMLGTLWAMAVGADAAKRGEGAIPGRDSDDFFFRQLRSPFERKLKGTRSVAASKVSFGAVVDASLKVKTYDLCGQKRSLFGLCKWSLERGCSAYGHSCFGGYGKRGGGLGSGLGSGRALSAPLAAAPLSSPPDRDAESQEDPEPDLEPEPPETRGSNVQNAAASDAEDATLIVIRQSPVRSRTPLWGRPSAPSATPARAFRADPERVDGSEAADDDSDPLITMSNRLFLRRWLRTYRRPGERSIM